MNRHGARRSQRIIGGSLRGRRLASPVPEGVRPTLDRVREALASALEARQAFQGARVLDLFCGTGALAFEALSRGALHATLVDARVPVLQAAKVNADCLNLQTKVRLLRCDLVKHPDRLEALLTSSGREPTSEAIPFSLVFVDPPYRFVTELGPLLELLGTSQTLSSRVLIAMEHEPNVPIPAPAALTVAKTYRYGGTEMVLFTPTACVSAEGHSAAS